MDLSTNKNDTFNICMEITGPFGGSPELIDCSPNTYNFSIYEEHIEEPIFNYESGVKIIDNLTNIKLNKYKTTTNTEKYNILNIFNSFVEDEQPISPGIYLVSRLILLDKSHIHTFYSKSVTFFVECKNNKLAVYDQVNSEYNINMLM